MLEVRPVRCSAILDALNSPELLAEYANECAMPDYLPQRSMYEELESRGGLQCFGAFISGELIGFISVVIVTMPHNGKKMATVESLFVSSAHRDSGAFSKLLEPAREFCKGLGCVALTYSARVGSRLETVLSRSAGCRATHTQFTEWL